MQDGSNFFKWINNENITEPWIDCCVAERWDNERFSARETDTIDEKFDKIVINWLQLLHESTADVPQLFSFSLFLTLLYSLALFLFLLRPFTKCVSLFLFSFPCLSSRFPFSNLNRLYVCFVLNFKNSCILWIYFLVARCGESHKNVEFGQLWLVVVDFSVLWSRCKLCACCVLLPDGIV